MNQNIINYLNENKEKYPKDVLAAELHKAGYSEGDIAEGVGQVFDGVAQTLAPAKTSFWNFKDKKVYTKASEKWADFLFGVFAPMIVGYVATSSVSLLLGLRSSPLISFLFFALEIAFIIYLFNRRRFISYGLIAPAIVLPIIAILFIAAMFGHMRF